jgi:hypothetical protein
MPGLIYALTIGKVLGQSTSAAASEDDSAEEFVDDDDNSESAAAQRTPSTDSADDFEHIEKSVDDLLKSKATSSQAQSGGKAKKRNKKR